MQIVSFNKNHLLILNNNSTYFSAMVEAAENQTPSHAESEIVKEPESFEVKKNNIFIRLFLV